VSGQRENAGDGLSLLGPLRDPDFRLLWGGQTISLVGDGLFTVALIWQTLQLSSSPLALGIVAFARSVPRLLLLMLGGAISDRVPRKRILLASDSCQAVAVSVIALLGATDNLRLWHLAGLAIVVGAAEAFFFPSFTGIVPELVGPELLVQANALTSGSRLLASEFLGPALGGVLVAAVGTTLAFGIDAISFLVSATALAAIRTPVVPPRRESKIVREVKEGLNFARSQPWLWVTLVSSGVANFAGAGCVAVLIPLLIKHRLGAGPEGLGAYFAAFGLGGGIGVLLSANFGPPRRRITVMYVVWIAGGLMCAVSGLAGNLAILLVCSASEGYFFEYGDVLWTALMQDLVPNEILGRVASVDWFMSAGLQPLALATAAPIAVVVGLSPAIVGLGLFGTIASAVGLYRPGVRDPERPA
jgi:MFS family permease